MLTLKVLTEIAISALLAPVMMLVQSRFVAEILCGKEVGWATQQRELDHIKLRDVARAHLGHTLTGIGLAVLTFSISTQVWFWLSPIWLPLVLATPVIFLTSRTIGRDRNLTEFRGFEGNRTMQTASRGVSEAGQHR